MNFCVWKFWQPIVWGMLLAIGVTACGGGTIGTGTGERSFEGQINFITGVPVSGADVTLAETGQSTVTDADGKFSIVSDFAGSTVNLMIDAGKVSTTVTVNTSVNDQADVSVNVTIDANHPQAVNVSAVQVRAQIIGSCDRDFENFRVIRQSNEIPNNMVCSVQVQIYGDGQLLERIPFIMQRSGCSGQNWTTTAQSETGFGVNAGVGTIQFTYENDSQHCVYRVVAPNGVKGVDSVIYDINTFMKQAFDNKH